MMERRARRVRAAEDRQRPRANTEDERDAVRPRAMQQDDVENNQPKCRAMRCRNRDLSCSGDMQVEDHAVEASVQGVKETREAVWQRDSDTRARSLNDPMPDSGMDMNSIVMNEQCEQRIQSFPTELVFIERNYFVEDSTWYGLNQGCVLGLTTMNLGDDLLQSKCEKMLHGQKNQRG